MANKLLLADDSQTIQKVVDLVLSPEGFRVSVFGDGEEALKAAEKDMPQIILADIDMPKLNGYQLCERLKASTATQHIPVILLAGAFEPFDEEYMKSVGAEDYILKPFESHELISKVKSILINYDMLDSAPEEPVRVAEPEVVQEPPKNEWFEDYHFGKQDAEPEPSHRFEADLQDSLKALDASWKEEELKSEPEALSIEEISRLVKSAVGELPRQEDYSAPRPVVQESHILIKKLDQSVIEEITRNSAEQVAAEVKVHMSEVVNRQVAELLPGLVESGLRDAFGEIAASIQGLVNEEIKKVVPDLAEKIIKQEIDKIISETR